MVKASSLAIAMAVVGGLAVDTTDQLLAAPIASNIMAIKQAAPAVVTDVRCGEYVGSCPRSSRYRNYPGYSDYSWGYPGYSGYWRGSPAYSGYGSYPAYAYSGYPGYSYWPYSGYGYGW